MAKNLILFSGTKIEDIYAMVLLRKLYHPIRFDLLNQYKKSQKLQLKFNKNICNIHENCSTSKTNQAIQESPLQNNENDHSMPKKIIEIQQVNFGYTEKIVLRDITLDIMEKDRIALLGKNGSGKSTFIKTLSQIIPSQSGQIRWCCPVHLATETPIYTIFSDPNEQLIMPTVYEEIALGLIQQNKSEQEISTIIQEQLMRFGILEYSNECPHNLSTGEKKKVLLALALSLNPQVLILDEPFLGLDVVSQQELSQYIQSIPNTQIIATHDYTYAKECCQKALVFHQRNIHYFANISSLLGNEEWMKQYELK